MKFEPTKPYITQLIPVPKDGKAFKVVFKSGDITPLLTKEDAEYVLAQTQKLSVRACVRAAIKGGE